MDKLRFEPLPIPAVALDLAQARAMMRNVEVCDGGFAYTKTVRTRPKGNRKARRRLESRKPL